MAEMQKAVVLVKKGEIKMEYRPIPSISKDSHDVKIQIMATGICGSDVHFYQDGGIGPLVVRSPMVLGHESSGYVVEIGDKVTSLKVGDRVAVEPGVPSRYSEETKAGNYNLCPHMAFAAAPPTDGTLVKYFISPEDFTHKLPDKVTFHQGALMEPLAVAVHSNKLANVRFGSKVVVFGTGPIAMLVSAVARAFGATVIVVGRNNDKLENIKANYGATEYVLESQVKQEGISISDFIKRSMKNKRGADVILECTGIQHYISEGIQSLTPGGAFISVGMGADNISVPMNIITMGEITIKGSFRYSQGDFHDAIELVNQDKISLEPMISKVFDFSQSIEAYEYSVHNRSEYTKIVINGPK